MSGTVTYGFICIILFNSHNDFIRWWWWWLSFNKLGNWVTERFRKLSRISSLAVLQSLSCVWLFATSWTAACQTPLSSSISRRLLRFMSVASVMLSNHLILCCLLLLSSVFPSIRIFSSESDLCSRWPKSWSFNISIDPSNEYSGLVFFRIDWFDLLGVKGTLKKSSPAPQFKSISSSVHSLLYDPTLTSVHDCWKNYIFDYTDLCWQSDVFAV